MNKHCCCHCIHYELEFKVRVAVLSAGTCSANLTTRRTRPMHDPSSQRGLAYAAAYARACRAAATSCVCHPEGVADDGLALADAALCRRVVGCEYPEEPRHARRRHSHSAIARARPQARWLQARPRERVATAGECVGVQRTNMVELEAQRARLARAVQNAGEGARVAHRLERAVALLVGVRDLAPLVELRVAILLQHEPHGSPIGRLRPEARIRVRVSQHRQRAP